MSSDGVWRRLRSSWIVLAALALTLVPLVALAFVAIAKSSSALERETDRRLRVSADLSADYIDGELRGLGEIAGSYARRPFLIAALSGTGGASVDVTAVTSQLADLRSARKGIAVAFVTDPSGRLLAIDPPTPSIVGQDFSYRDWYRGVTASGRSYISESYQSAATGAPTVVAAASPVRAGDGKIVAILVAAYDVGTIESFASDLTRSQDIRIEVLDQRHQPVAGPQLIEPATLDVARAQAGQGRAVRVTPRSDADLTAVAAAADTGWTVVAGVDAKDAMAPVRALRSAVLAIAAGLAVALLCGVALFVGLLGRYRHNETRLVAAEAESMEASRLKSEFLANMSHEIRTPLNGVIGMSELLAGTRLDAVQAEYVEALDRSGEALLGLINDILDLSKIEAGRLELDDEPFSPGAVVEEVAALLAPRCDEVMVEFVVDVAAGAPELVHGDGQRFRQVITNFVSNAIKFTAAGEVVVRLEATPAGDEVDLRVSVTDTGIGISTNALESVFASFTQAESSTTRRFGGTGLGLTIARQLAEAMGGQVGVSSEVGVGSTFWFTIRARCAAPARPLVRSTLRGVRVLVVDDNATNRRVVEDNLRSWGMQATTAVDGQHALELLAQAPPGESRFDLALLDFHMPGMDGVQLAKAIRSDERHREVVLALLTSTSQEGELWAAREAGIRTRLVKPVRQSVLYDRLVEAMAEATPRTDPTEVHPDAVLERPRPTTGASRGRVLVAEDNEINRRVAAGMLSRLGYETVLAFDGADAVEKVQAESFSLVLMDCQMPVLDGFEATLAIRALEASGSARTPIVALTANAMRSDHEKCLAAGMDGYLSKPITSRKLQTVLASWVGRGDVADDVGDVESDEGDKRPGGVDDVLDYAVVEELRQLFKSDKSGAKDPCETFLTSAGERIVELRTALQGGRRSDVMALTHSLRGSALTFGANGVGAVAADIERLVDAGQFAEATARYDDLTENLTRAANALSHAFGRTA